MTTMKMLVALALLVGAVSAAGKLELAIHKQMPSWNDLIARRAAGVAVPHKFAQLNKGEQKTSVFYDNFYLANCTVGSPPQTFQIIPDTGSSNLWVVGKECKEQICDGLDNPSLGIKFRKQKYDRTKSSTYKKDGRFWSIQYGSGSANGDLVKDTLSFAGLTVKQITFGVAKQIAQVFAYFPMSGIFGMGWPALAEDGVEPPINAVLSQLDKPIFTVWLDRHVKPAKGVVGGLITYGDFDKKNCDADVVYVPLSSLSYWQFPITGVAYGSYSVDKRQEAISDTGTSFIIGPTDAVQAIQRIAGASYDFGSGLYTVPCNKVASLPPLIFKINGKPLAIPASEHVVDLDLPGGQCAFGLDTSFGFGFDWLLGDAWIRSWCQIYDVGQKRIGFAKAHHKEV